MRTIDGARCFQAMVPMRDGVRLNTFVFLPENGGSRSPVILQRTPYGITSPEGRHVTDCTKGWLPDPRAPLRGSLLRSWREIVRRGYVTVYQDTRGRDGSEGEDHVYGDDAADIQIATNVVHHSEEWLSFLVFPLLPSSSAPAKDVSPVHLSE